MRRSGYAVLGPLELVPEDGGPVQPGGPKQRELLGLLLLHRGRALSASRLVADLWGDHPPDGAEVTLRSHVSHLRRRIAQALPSSAVVTGPTGYLLTTGDAVVDADEFEQLLGQGQESLGLGRPDQAVASLREALDLWRGPAWVELGHVDAAVADAARLDELHIVAQEVLVTAELARGRHRDVVPELEALQAAHPFRERLAGQLMLALYRSGRQADALAVYAEARERLADELGLDPGPELQELSQAILRQDAALAPDAVERADRRGRRTPQDAVDDAVLSALAAAPHVGRARERSRLDQVWRAISDEGSRRLVVVSGEAGIGKSRLVAGLVQTAVDDGAAVLVGRCDGTHAAYHPMADALRSSPAARAVLSESPASWPALGRLIGGTADGPHPESVAGLPASHTELHALLARLATAGPVLLVVEDAEGIDRASARLLRHVAARLPAGVGAVVAYRDPPGGQHPELLELLGDTGLQALTDRVVLEPLDLEATRELLARTSPGLDPDVAGRLWEHTGGNPYFVTELARSRAVVGDVAVPAGIREVLARRLATLSEPARSALSAAAVLGREVDFVLVAQLLDDEEDAVAAALDEAVAAGFLVESGLSWSASYAFPHELMREATERHLVPPARRRLHRRAADALQERTGEGAGVAAKVVRHLRASGPLAEAAETAEWCLRAAREARSLEAWDEAIEHAELGVRLLATLPDRTAYAAAAEETATLLIRSSRDFPRAVALLEEALAVHVDARDEERTAALHGRLGVALSLQHSVLDVPRALEHLDAAERLQPGIESVQVHSGRAQAAMFGVRTALLEASSDTVRAIAERDRRRDLVVAAGWARGWATFNRGLLAESAAVAESTWRAAHDLGNSYLVWGAAQAPAVRSSIYLLDPAAARAWCRRALGQPRFTGLSHSHGTVLDQLGLVLLMTGDTPAAREVIAPLPSTALSRRLLVLLDGDWEAAADDWAATMATDEAAGDLHDAAVNALWLSEARQLLGDLDGALRALERAAEIGASGPQVPVELAARAELARLLSAADPAAAGAHLARCDEILADGEDWRGRAGRVSLARAHVLAQRAEVEQAQAALDAARQVFTDLRLAWHRAEAETAHAALFGGGTEAAVAAYRSLAAPDRWVERALHTASTPLPHPPATVLP